MEIVLNELPQSAVGIITRLSDHSPMRRRLLDLGFVPGETVECMFPNIGNSLKAYGICGGVIALRRGDAAGILVEYSI